MDHNTVSRPKRRKPGTLAAGQVETVEQFEARGGKPGDLSRYVASGMLHTLNSIANEDQGPVRRRLIDCLVRRARALRRNESELRSATRRQKEVA